MKKIVVIGGGTGQSTLLRGLKLIDNLEISTIVTVADDGGSTGRIRDNYLIPAVGDIRNVLVALAPEETVFSSLMSYRFEGSKDNELSGHSLGNLILLALTEISDNFMEAISRASEVLNVKGTIIPSTLEIVTLFAQMEDGTIVRGESNIPKARNHILKVFYQEDVHASGQAIKAIQEADIIVYGIGSLYTSIMPNLIIPEIREAIQSSKALKVYYNNVMTQVGETDGYSCEMHVQAIIDHVNDPVDIVVFAADEIPDEIKEIYHAKQQDMVSLSNSVHPEYKVLKHELLTFEGKQIRHNPQKIVQSFESILRERDHRCPSPVK